MNTLPIRVIQFVKKLDKLLDHMNIRWYRDQQISTLPIAELVARIIYDAQPWSSPGKSVCDSEACHGLTSRTEEYYACVRQHHWQKVEPKDGKQNGLPAVLHVRFIRLVNGRSVVAFGTSPVCSLWSNQSNFVLVYFRILYPCAESSRLHDYQDQIVD